MKFYKLFNERARLITVASE